MKRLLILMALACAAGCANSGPDAVFASMVVSPKQGTAGPVKLGMTPDEAIAVLGQPESRYPDFLAWRGGKFTAVVAEGKIASIRVSDPAISVDGFYVGATLEEAKKAFPGGKYAIDEVPVYELPEVKHAWLEVMPSVEHEVLAVVMSAKERPEHHD